MLSLRAALLLASALHAGAARMKMHEAAERGEVEPLKVAIEGRWDEYNDRRVKPKINGKDKRGKVALHLAVCNRRLDIEPVQVLLERGADANARDGRDLTPLHTVASNCNGNSWTSEREMIKAAKLLLKHGANVEAVATDEEVTPVHVAAKAGRTKIVELLLAKGGRPQAVHAKDKGGATPLHHAVRGGSEKTVLALLLAGADPHTQDRDGRTAHAELGDGTDVFTTRIRSHLDRYAEALAKSKDALRAAARDAAADGGKAKAEL